MEWIIDQRLASLIEGIGQVREEMRSEFKAMIDALRTEMLSVIAARPVEVDISARLVDIGGRLEHIDRLLEKMVKSDIALGLARNGDVGMLVELIDIAAG